MARKARKLHRVRKRNLELNRKEASEGRQSLESLPVSLYVDIDLRCNLRCPSCHRSDPRLAGSKWPTMEFGLFEKIARELFPTACRVNLSGGGESLLNRDFDRMIGLCIEYGTRPILYTNGLALSAERARLLARAGACVAVSADGATTETFEKLRYPMKWSQLLRALENIRSARGGAGSGIFPYFGVVIQRDNVGELEGFVELAEEYGLEQINYSKLYPHYPELEKLAADPEAAARELVKVLERANRSGIRIELPDYGETESGERLLSLKEGNEFPVSLDRNNPFGIRIPGTGDTFVKYPSILSPECRVPWSETMITPEGKVAVGCCASGFQPGDLTVSSFADIWNNEHYLRLRETVNTGAPLEICSSEVCPFRS